MNYTRGVTLGMGLRRTIVPVLERAYAPAKSAGFAADNPSGAVSLGFGHPQELTLYLKRNFLSVLLRFQPLSSLT